MGNQAKLYHLTSAQKGVYFACRNNPTSTMYNLAYAFPLAKDIDLARFEEALKRVSQKHPSLFATFCEKDGEPFMVPGKAEVTIERKNADSFETAMADYAKPFDLFTGPLYRFTVFETPEGPIFLLDIHHLLFDGISLTLFMNQIGSAYEGEQIPDETRTLFDISEYEETLEDSERYKEAKTYFDNMLSDTSLEQCLLSDVCESNCGSGEGIFYQKLTGALSVANLKRFAGACGVSESTLFMTAFAYTLATYGGMQEVSFSTGSGGRYKMNLEKTGGMFVKLLPVVFSFDENLAIAKVLQKIQQSFYETLRHDAIDFGYLVGKYGVSADTTFVYQGDLLEGARIAGAICRPIELPLSNCRSSLHCSVEKEDEGYGLYLRYNKDVYSDALMTHVGLTMIEIIKGFTTCETLADLQLVSKEASAVYDANNDTAFSYDQNETVGSLLETALSKNLKKNADKIALSGPDASYSYKEFDDITKKIAKAVQNKGIGTNDFVAVYAPRNSMSVLAVWGVIRAGAGVMPLDPTYPAERLRFMLKDSGAKLLITDRSATDLPKGFTGEVLYFDEIDALPASAQFPICDKKAGALGIIYTSGTTGQPKGCVLENRNLVAFFHNHQTIMGLSENARVASYASFGFDAGLMDILSTYLAGGTLFIIPDADRLDLAKLERFYCENEITHGFMTTQVGRMFAEETACKSLEAFLVGGEKLVPFTPSEHFRFVNGYGPCETMAYICSYVVKNRDEIQPIGKPSGNTKLYVTDNKGRLLPPGAVGELGIAGFQVGRGYLNLPEKTADVFTQNVFSDAPGYERIYHTGDMVRLLPDGNIDFVGRRDGQVKIRGFRVELTEIEEVIRRFPGVTDATVAAFDEEGGGKYIAAYVVSKKTLSIDDLHDFIAKQKPPYMVPSVTMQIDAIPYTQNQKVNKRALPVPKRAAKEIVGPSTDYEKKIYEIAVSILGHSAFGVTTDLFEAGLTSIGLLKFNALVSKALDRPVSIKDVKMHASIRELAVFFGESASEAEYPKFGVYSLMQNQMGIFVEAGMKKESTQYNIPLLFKLAKEVDVIRLQDALCKAIDAHPYMKLMLSTDSKGEIHALRRDEDLPIVEYIETDQLPDNPVVPFSILGSRLYRARIYVTKEDNYLFLDIHHIIGDGTSLRVLLQDVNDAYAGKMLSKEQYSCFEASLDEEKMLKESIAEHAKSYYEKLLAGCNTESLPGKCPEENPSEKGSVCRYSFADCSKEIGAFIAKHKLSANAFFNAVFSYTLSVFLHSEDITYCTIYNGRSDSRLASAFGMLVKTLPVRCFVDPKDSVLSFTEKMKKQLLDTMANDQVSFAELCKLYGLHSDLFFNYQGEEFVFDTVGGQQALLISQAEEAKAPLSVEVFLQDGIYSALVTYRSDFFCKEMTDALIGMMRNVAAGFTKCEVLSEIEFLPKEELLQYDMLNATDVAFSKVPAHERFADYAAKNPKKAAVYTKDSVTDFDSLNKQVNRLANALLDRGICRDEVVGVILDRSVLVPVAEFGIMKAGGAFMNMLPTYPDDRIEFCMKDAGCKLILTTKDILTSREALFSSDKPYSAICLEDVLSGENTKNPNVPIDMTQLAYAIYTSGSTGTPKGVMLEHHNLTNFIETSGLRALEEKGNCILCMASISFDMSLTEMLFSLCLGKSIYIASEEEVHNPDLLLAAMQKHGVDMMMMTPSFAWSLLSIPDFASALANLRAVALGAEAFLPILYDKLKALNSDMMIVNGYGPTECTQVCSAKVLNSGENLTIGKPFANTKFYVTDAFGRLLPRYAVGELVICGEGVCRGYVNLLEKNRETFTQIGGTRGYKSGDLVRINRDLEAEFGGRADNQVKLRGFRIELDEVEAVMSQFPGIGRCKVVVQNNGSEDFLAGFYTTENPIDPEEFTAYLKSKLTYYMVPAAMVELPKMPLTPNGKIDKKALPLATPVKTHKAGRQPARVIEKKIVDLFKETLHLDTCFADDNFFEIGGTSLSAAKIVMQLKADGYKIEYQDIFDCQTAEELSDLLAGQKGEEDNAQILIETDLEKKDEELPISELLKYNTLEHAPEVTRKPLGDVLLTGASGFLGIHILQALLTYETGRIICLLRKGHHDDVKTRLMASLVYYFENDYKEAFGNRIEVIEGDITDRNLQDLFKDRSFDTLINCAASVKHYANDDSIRFVNVFGVENLIALCKVKNAKMIQISTTSIPGVHTAETYKNRVVMHENELFVVEDMNNQYCRSKYQAELCMLHAIKDGMRGKIIRVGNLMGRHSDGEFQTNMHTNAFLNGLRGFVTIGKCPLSHATDPISFSPVDCTAKAVVLLAGCDDRFTAFHAESRSTFDEMKIVEAINRCGLKLTPVADQEYYDEFYNIMGDPSRNAKVSALLTNDRPDLHMVEADNRFTANILYRLGFSWPFIDDEYLERVITSLDALDFFFME